MKNIFIKPCSIYEDIVYFISIFVRIETHSRTLQEIVLTMYPYVSCYPRRRKLASGLCIEDRTL